MAKCNWDIGLAPMPESEFHRCKYFNKYVEYASFGIAGIYSDCEPYIYGIRDKENGLLCKNTTEDWVEAISLLIDNKKLREKISKECLKEANEVYALDILAEDYLNKITADYSESIGNSKIPGLGFAKFIIFFKRVFRKIKEQGLNFPMWLKNKLEEKLEDRNEFKKNVANKTRLEEIISEREVIFIVSPMFDDSSNVYNNRVKKVDEMFKDYYRIYYSGEDRLAEQLKIDFIDDDHATIICNSFDILQTEEILKLIEKCQNCLIHSVIRFMRDKISSDMYKLFDLENVRTYWDSHGMIPEEYHEAANFHTEEVTGDIEKIFYEKVDVLLVETEKEKKHFIDKYGKRDDMEYIVYK